jgi:hydrogenase maturation protease
MTSGAIPRLISGGVVRKISIIGFGNIFNGDLGIGCYVIDALCQEPLGESVELCYLGEDLHHAGAFVSGMEFAVIVGGLSVEGCAGSVHCWDKKTFQQNCLWLIEKSESMRLLAQSLTMAEFSGCFPHDLLFLWIASNLPESRNRCGPIFIHNGGQMFADQSLKQLG